MNQTLIFETTIASPIETVYAHLADPRNFLELQPLLVGISGIRESEAQGVKVLRYENVEAFRLLGFTYRNRIQVELKLTQPPARLEAHVKSPGGVTLEVEYHFIKTEQGTTLREVFHVQMPRLVKNFVIAQATQAQNEVLRRLKARFES